jgi:hypothetical protein
MLKHQMLIELAGKLATMGIPSRQEAGTDMAVRTEFLDAGWSTGIKKISYEALLFANEQDQTVYLYEKTTESGHGISFGGGSGTTFQSGTTLFRKVKSIQYGPEGKAYEYSLDLGSIPKAVKETAKQYGWKFKTVLDKRKAMYPMGYVPEPVPPAQGQWGPMRGSPPQTNPQQPAGLQYGNPSGPFHASAPRKSGGKGGTIGLIGFILLGLVLLVMLWAAIRCHIAGPGLTSFDRHLMLRGKQQEGLLIAYQ